ncbi:uncharacterized protein N7473_001572 [Penicillium subrubescens]|uniref:uncharacterized protein n=1 Tax=Penicillium subrubescens TaxID=1316194 RepID=UPI0025458A7C|nr:uncharacterized protein N7473_001572 [Penicillium subrubescens]KAJ5904656.1 hypothetical protein N7473_001572 [Penicillium subrubescens]
MYSRNATPWSKREEDNLLPWLEENSELPWIARSGAYLDQVGVKRSVESLRGKKYHILRKRRHGRVRPSRRTTTSKGRGKSRRPRATSNTRCNLSSSDSISCRNVRRWLHDIPEVAPDGVKSQELPSAEASSYAHESYSPSRDGRENRSFSKLWNYVHWVCEQRRLI